MDASVKEPFLYIGLRCALLQESENLPEVIERLHNLDTLVYFKIVKMLFSERQ